VEKVVTVTPAPTPTPLAPIVIKNESYPKGWTTSLSAPPFRFPQTTEITVALRENPNAQYAEGDDPINLPSHRLIRDAFGLWPKAKFIYSTDYDTKMLAAMADQDLPDIFELNPQLFGRFLQAGALEDITDVWESTASPLLKEYAGRYGGRILKGPIVNGRMMGLPSGAKFQAQDNMLVYYRKDLLDKLGLNPPETIAEFEEILRAAKKEFGGDPAWINLPGNRVMITWINSFDVFFGPTGAIPSVGRTDIRIWVKGLDGKLIYGSADERIKPILEMLARWYKEGLIDPEFYTRDEAKSTEPVAAGKCIMFVAPAWGIGWPGGLTAQNVPEAEWGFTLPPKGANGQRGWMETNPTYGYVKGFRKGIDPKLVEASIQVMNWTLENLLKWRERNIYGFDFYDWAYDKENQVYTVKNRRPGNYLMHPAVASTWGGYYLESSTHFYDYLYELGRGPRAGLNGWQEALVADYDSPKLGEKDTFPVVVQGAGKGIYTEFYGPPTSTQAKRGAQLDKLEQETFTALVTGSQPIEAFDKFVEDWLRNGGDEITQEVNHWYETGESL
jgi:putative aldouronate transport system substrate-binding protein